MYLQNKVELLKYYKFIYITDTKSVFFLPIANWYLPLSHVYLPIDWKMKVKNNDDLHKDLEDKLGHPKLFLVLYAPENDAKPSPDWINTNKHT